MPLERAHIEAGLRSKGFVEEERDHRFYTLVVNGRYTGIWTKTSRGTGYKTLGDNLVAKIARELKLSRKQFEDLVQCPMSFEQYVAHLRERDEL
jgi:hypothetical protein